MGSSILHVVSVSVGRRIATAFLLKTLIIVDVFTILLLSNGHGADHIENKSRDIYLASPLAR
jgi:hypothetical protein